MLRCRLTYCTYLLYSLAVSLALLINDYKCLTLAAEFGADTVHGKH